MKTYYVYMLRCADGSFYVGITSNPEARIAQHQLGIDPKCYTFTRRPVELVYAADFGNVYDAIAWEKHIKGWSRAKKAALIQDDWRGIHALATCKNATSAANYRRSSFDAACPERSRRAQDDKEPPAG